jgi:hypothetical protein
LEYPRQSLLGKLVLSDFDIALIRQLNGESTCEGSWSPELTIAVSENRKAEAKAKAEAEAKAKAEAEAKAEIMRTAKKTITCVKGKTSKKITALKPKCPPGYTKK